MAAALRLDPVGAIPPSRSPSRRPAETPKKPLLSKTTCSDRFIPCRSSRFHNFALIDSSSSSSKDPDTPYSRLLRTELFGPDSPGLSPQGDAPTSPNTNLFLLNLPSLCCCHHCFTAGSGDTSIASPKRPPRKVPKTPHKVLDAPSVQDDFYLNLVDWFSQNMLAVGLGTCV